MARGFHSLVVFFSAAGFPVTQSKADSNACPGSFEVSGHGRTSIIPTGWNAKGEAPAANIHVQGNTLSADHGSRGYFANQCNAGKYNHTDYANINLLGKTIAFDVDFDGAGCGCNIAFYLVSMGQNTHPSECHDYYCDANDVCGESCSEIDIMEGNANSWHSTLHTMFDHGGMGGGLGGGDGWNGPRDFTKEQYGPGGYCIDTMNPFHVEVSFPVDWSGNLNAMDVKLSQLGKSCPLSIHLGEYPGNAELGRSLKAGMVPVFSYWSSDKMLWMDGNGPDGKGNCAVDVPSACMKKKPKIMNIEIVSQGPPCAERCPAGVCEKYPDGEEAGNCRWFFGYTSDDGSYTPSAYHCIVADCKLVPDVEGYSSCQTENGQHHYRISDRNAQCQKKKSQEEQQAEIDKIKKEHEEEKEKEDSEEASLTTDCPASFQAKGIGNVAITPAGWKNSQGAPVEVSGGTVKPHLYARGYFASSCVAGEYDNDKYLGLKLLGHQLAFTVDVSGAGCGCKAQLQLVSMKQNKDPTDCQDHYCNVNAVCGATCAEIDIMEGNRFAWHTTLHSEYDSEGEKVGYGGADGYNGPRDFVSKQYGPGGECIDTRRPFDVVAAFPMDQYGELKEMRVNLTQKGRPCHLSVVITNYDGMGEISEALKLGMTPLVDYWASDEVLWLDGEGSDGQGPCKEDVPNKCAETVSFSNFQMVDLKESAKEKQKGTCKGSYVVKPECKMDFTYQGSSMSGCTNRDAKDHYWCSHDTDYKGKFSWCEPCQEVIGGRVVDILKPSQTANKGPKVLEANSQCGGRGFKGTKQCIDGYVCQFSNEWWSHCMQVKEGNNQVCYDGWLPHKGCQTTFVYDDTEYMGCSTIDNEGKGWCSIDPKYNNNWKSCQKCIENDNKVIIVNDFAVSNSALRGLAGDYGVGAVVAGLAAALALGVMAFALLGIAKRYRNHHSASPLSSEPRDVFIVPSAED